MFSAAQLNFNKGTSAWMDKIVRMLTFKQFRNKKSALQQICDDLTKGKLSPINCDKNPIAASSNIKGNPRTPINGIIHTLETAENFDLYVGDERNTSQKCSRCFNQLIFPAKQRGERLKRNIYCPRSTTTRQIA